MMNEAKVATLVTQTISLQKITSLLLKESFVVLGCIIALAWLFHRLALKLMSSERHSMLRSDFKALLFHFFFALFLSAVFWIYAPSPLKEGFQETSVLARFFAYWGVLSLIWFGVAFVKTFRLILFEALFFRSMRVGVPVLLVNCSVLCLSLILISWFVSFLFDINLGPFLATSAVVSIVLGLALQETLGNLFSGISLQFDKPYEIGDWIEVQSGDMKWSGQVQEITWRATVLIGFGDENLTVPNRMIAQASISNFAAHDRPFWRSLLFHFPYGTDVEKAKSILLSQAGAVSKVSIYPAPLALVRELHESWIEVRLLYCIEDFGAQFIISDQILSKSLAALDQSGIQLAPRRISVLK